jgi:aryl-alcohol dehydrogenase-like predicted oxidoreductase
MGQMALAWVNSHTDTHAIAGARNADQVIQNTRAAEVALSENDLTRMDEIGRHVTDHLDENPVMWRS